MKYFAVMHYKYAQQICTQTSVQKGTVAMDAELAHCSVSIPRSVLVHLLWV